MVYKRNRGGAVRFFNPVVPSYPEPKVALCRIRFGLATLCSRREAPRLVASCAPHWREGTRGRRPIVLTGEQVLLATAVGINADL